MHQDKIEKWKQTLQWRLEGQQATFTFIELGGEPEPALSGLPIVAVAQMPEWTLAFVVPATRPSSVWHIETLMLRAKDRGAYKYAAALKEVYTCLLAQEKRTPNLEVKPLLDRRATSLWQKVTFEQRYALTDYTKLPRDE